MSKNLSLKLACAHFSILALAACASGGNTTSSAVSSAGAVMEPDPILQPDNSLADPRNIVLTNISYLHPAATDGIDETFDLAVAGITVSPDASSQAVSYSGVFNADFGSGQRMRYDANENTFTLDIGISDRLFNGEAAPDIVLNDTFGNMLLTNPVEIDGLANGISPILIAALTDAFPVPDNLESDPAEADAFLTALKESSNDNDAALLTQIQNIVQTLLEQDTFSYSGTNTTKYHQVKLDNNGVTTYNSALGVWSDTDANGNLVYGHTVFGYHTPLGDIPTTGTASYQGTHAGSMWYQNQTVSTTGGVSTMIDFDTDQVTWNMGVRIVEEGFEGEPIYLDYDTFTGTGNVSGTSLSGTMRAVGETSLNGTYNGKFFGVAGEEIGGTYHFTNGEVAGAGSFVAADEVRDVTNGTQ